MEWCKMGILYIKQAIKLKRLTIKNIINQYFIWFCGDYHPQKTKNLNERLQLKDETAYAGLGFFATRN
jgi:predicted metal-dependent hydrolase